MDELLKTQRENFNFLDRPLTELEDQVWHELCNIETYYLQREADGELYTSNQKYVIDTNVEKIKVLLREKKVDEAAITVVALMETMGMIIKLVAVKGYMETQGIEVASIVDVDTFDYPFGKGRGKHL